MPGLTTGFPGRSGFKEVTDMLIVNLVLIGYLSLKIVNRIIPEEEY